MLELNGNEQQILQHLAERYFYSRPQHEGDEIVKLGAYLINCPEFDYLQETLDNELLVRFNRTSLNQTPRIELFAGDYDANNTIIYYLSSHTLDIHLGYTRGYFKVKKCGSCIRYDIESQTIH